MKLMKYLGALIVAALLLFVFVANFSTVESRFQCSGEISSESDSQPATIYMRIEEYRWWVGLWSESDGSVWLEVPNRTFDYFGHVIEVGEQLQIFDSQKKPKGHFSTLSKSLSISTPAWSFNGTCKRND